MSLTKITPTRNLYNRLEQSHSGYGQDAAILEYYACGDFDRTYFEQGLLCTLHLSYGTGIFCTDKKKISTKSNKTCGVSG